MHSSEDKTKDDAELTVVFGKNAIRIKFKEMDRYEKGETLIRIDSGKIYMLNTEKKTFTSKKLREFGSQSLQLPAKEIAGYKTSSVKAAGATAIGSMAAMFRLRDVVCYTADSLNYTVPEKYASNAEFAFLHEGKIILGAEMKPPTWSFGDGDEDDIDMREAMRSVTIEAISVKWETFKDDDLSVPPGYVKHQYNRYPSDSLYALDSAITMTDSVKPAKPMETKPVKKPATNKKQPIKPKINKTQPGVIRKPD